MEVTVLRNCIQSTLDPNADARRQAELDLKYVCYHGFTYPLPSSTIAKSFRCRSTAKAENQPGFTSALLDILQAEQDNGIRLSSVFSRYCSVESCTDIL